jgi:hypothetical protein
MATAVPAGLDATDRGRGRRAERAWARLLVLFKGALA